MFGYLFLLPIEAAFKLHFPTDYEKMYNRSHYHINDIFFIIMMTGLIIANKNKL